jgi:hypothetical protein
MLNDSNFNLKKHSSSLPTSEKPMPALLDSISQLKNSKELLVLPHPRPFQRKQMDREPFRRNLLPSAALLSNIDTSFSANTKFYKPNTPTASFVYSFQTVKPARLALQNVSRPISVDCKEPRPVFLEPEVEKSHFPNKSMLITPNASKNSEEGYRFPLFRTKQIKGFRLSVSPEVNENEIGGKFAKGSGGYMSNSGINSRTQRTPMSAMGKRSGKRVEFSGGSALIAAYGFK